jgi:hypothetical protein
MTSLSKNARIAGLLYIVGSLFGVVRLIYIPSALFVQGNAAATVSNIATHEMLFRFGIVTYLIGSALWIFVTLALYRLFEGVDQALAIVMVILGSLVVVPIFFFNSVNDGAALLFARGGDFVSVFDKPQREAFVMLFLRLHHMGDLANGIFWGLWLVPLGLLVYRSRFLPRFLGIWLMIGCFGYLMFSFTGLLYPAYEDTAFKLSQPFTVSEVAFMLWLVIMGAKERRPPTDTETRTPVSRSISA